MDQSLINKKSSHKRSNKFNLISDFYTYMDPLNNTAITFNNQLQLNIESMDNFKIFLISQVGFQASPQILPNFYLNDFVQIINLVDIKKGTITQVYDFLGEPRYLKDWNKTIFNYILNLRDGLNIMMGKLTSVFWDASGGGYIKVANESNFTYKNTRIDEVINDIIKYTLDISALLQDIVDIINEKDNINLTTMIENIKKDQKLIDLIDKTEVAKLQANITDINLIIQEIDHLKNITKVFKNYIIIEKIFEITDLNIEDETDFNNTWKNNITLKDYVDKKYIFDANMKQYIKFISEFLNSDYKGSIDYIFFFKRVNQLKSENKPIYNNMRIQNYDTDVTDNDIQIFVTEFNTDFKNLISENNMKLFQNQIHSFHNYIIDPNLLSELKTKIPNFKLFLNFQLRDIFVNLDANNTLFEGINGDFLKEISQNIYYQLFFGGNKYEDSILIVYPKSVDRKLNFNNDIIISSHFNMGIYGTVKEFIESFINIYDTKINPAKISKKNKIIQYILMTDDNINNKNTDVLKEQIKTVDLENANIKFSNKMKNIKNLLTRIINEMRTKDNIKKAFSDYNAALKIPQ